MEKRKGFVLVLALLMVMGITGCGGGASEEASGEESTWAATVNLNQEVSVDELYQLAKDEGKVVIYSMSSRLNDVKETFEARYPGIEVVVYDMRIAEILEKYQREHEAGIRTADVLLIKDSDGAVEMEFVKQGLLHEYIPRDMMVAAPEAFQTGPYVPYFEMKQIYFNTEVYDACPVDSWWDLTRPEYNGKIMMGNPLQTPAIMGIFLSMVSHSDEMERSYREEFGEEIVLNGTENAGYEFVKRLVANDLILTTSDGDVIKAVGAPGQSNPPFGVATSSKMRKAGPDLHINVAESLAPRMGNTDPALLYVADQCEHPNAAKLLIRWIGGELDGKGEGFKPFHVQGSWPTRADVPTIKTQPLESLNVWDVDLAYNYQNMDTIRNYWISLQ